MVVSSVLAVACNLALLFCWSCRNNSCCWNERKCCGTFAIVFIWVVRDSAERKLPTTAFVTLWTEVSAASWLGELSSMDVLRGALLLCFSPPDFRFHSAFFPHGNPACEVQRWASTKSRRHWVWSAQAEAAGRGRKSISSDFPWCSLILIYFCIAMVMDRGFLHNFSLFISSHGKKEKRLTVPFQHQPRCWKLGSFNLQHWSPSCASCYGFFYSSFWMAPWKCWVTWSLFSSPADSGSSRGMCCSVALAWNVAGEDHV